MDTLAVLLTLPLAGCVGDLHPQVNAPCRAHQEKEASVARLFWTGPDCIELEDHRELHLSAKTKPGGSTDWQPVELNNTPTFNNLQQQQSRQLTVGVQQSDMISVNLSARSDNNLHTHLRWFESHNICLVQHPRYPQGQLRNA